MNASLQALFASPKFCSYLAKLNLDRNASGSKQEVLFSLAWLGKVISEEEMADNSNILNEVVTFIGESLAQERLQFDPYIQHDAHEFVNKMLEALQRDILKYADDEKDICKDLFMLISSFLPTTCSR
jgi:hypothetical protein